jgi:glycosyltransferase involved in cell wall biosynthesis
MTKDMKSKQLCVVLTSPFVLNAFLLQHLSALADHYRVTVCINTMEGLVSNALDPRIEVLHIGIERKIRPWSDAKALWQLIRLNKSRPFDAVHSLTPKGGLLGMLAAWLCRVPVRTHVFTGQVWATRTGLFRRLLRSIDQLVAGLATDVWADSQSQAQFLVAEGVCQLGRIRVPGDGSLSGVNVRRFASDSQRREQVRQALGIADDIPVFLFLGRLQREKGVLVLVEAFRRLSLKHDTAHLLWVGPDEDHLAEQAASAASGRSHVLGLTQTPEDYIDAADVLVLPSFREGFGTVVIEAAAMGCPAVASRIYGLTDAVIHEQTGLLVPPADADKLYQAMERMLDTRERERLGINARTRAINHFSADRLTRYWVSHYARKLGNEAEQNVG